MEDCCKLLSYPLQYHFNMYFLVLLYILGVFYELFDFRYVRSYCNLDYALAGLTREITLQNQSCYVSKVFGCYIYETI